MFVLYFVHRCPHCKHFVEAHFFGRTGLGPAQYICRKCGQPFASRRQEWPQWGGGRRIWYVILSLVYAGVVGFLLMMASAIALSALDLSDSVTKTYSRAALFAGAAAVVLLQIFRIRVSIRRAAAPPLPLRPGFFGLVANLQLQILLGWLVIFAAGLTVSLLRDPPAP